jgi:histidinol-phosphate aminotransferase
MQDAKRYWSRGLEEVPAYIPGEQPQGGGWIKLNTNENPYGPSPKALEAAQPILHDNVLRLYPEPSGQVIREAVAAVHGIDPENVFCGNGSDEVLAFAFRAFFDQGAPVLFPDLTYSFYPIWSRAFSLPFRTIPLREDFSIDPSDYSGPCGGIVFPNPNAPTGRILSSEAIEGMLRDHPDVLVLVDEAYIDFGGRTAIPLTLEYPNLLVVHTLSKSRSLAGLRASFAVGSPGLVPALDRVRDWYNSYTLDRVAQAAAAAAIRDVEWTQRICGKISATRDRFSAELVRRGWDVVPSTANFVFAAHPTLTARQLLEHLRAHKILVRAFSGARLERHARITVGTDAEMDAVLSFLP